MQPDTGFNPAALLGVSAGVGQQPAEAAQTAGSSEALKQMLGVVSAMAENNPAAAEGARMARQGIVQMLLAMNSEQPPSNAQMMAQ